VIIDSLDNLRNYSK